jgi:hypothetical protein
VTNLDGSFAGPNEEGTADTFSSLPHGVHEIVLVD